MLSQQPLRYVGTLDASASAIAFASASASRWVMTNFTLGWENVSVNAAMATFMLFEGDTATASTIFFQFDVSTSSGFYSIDHREVGIQASDAGTSMRLQTGTSEIGTFSVMFTGYYGGG